jgi:hypothetical protein
MIAIDRHKQDVTQLAGLLQITDVTGMEQIEAAIGQNEIFPFRGIAGTKGRKPITSHKSFHVHNDQKSSNRWKEDSRIFSTPKAI